jgi:hypothetical protein
MAYQIVGKWGVSSALSRTRWCAGYLLCNSLIADEERANTQDGTQPERPRPGSRLPRYIMDSFEDDGQV